MTNELEHGSGSSSPIQGAGITASSEAIERGLRESDALAVTLEQIEEYRESHPEMADVSNLALKVLLEQGNSWRVRLFAQCLVDRVLALDSLRHKVIARKVEPSGREIPPEEMLDWLIAHMERFRELVSELSGAMASASLTLTDKTDLRPGPLLGIADGLAAAYQSVLELTLQIITVDTDPAFRQTVRELASITACLVSDFPSWAYETKERIESGHLEASNGRSVNLDSTFNIIAPDGADPVAVLQETLTALARSSFEPYRNSGRQRGAR